MALSGVFGKDSSSLHLRNPSKLGLDQPLKECHLKFGHRLRLAAKVASIRFTEIVEKFFVVVGQADHDGLKERDVGRKIVQV